MRSFRLLKYLTLMLFVIYWLSSVLANSPNCFIRIETLKYSKKFKELFSQRWNFFAPPPNYNARLYYEFFTVSEEGDTISLSNIEVMEPIALAKQKKRPFNAREEILDYSVNSAFIDFIEYRSKAIDLAKMKQEGSENEIEIWETASEYINKHFFLTFSSSVLYNYGIRIAREKGYDQSTLMRLSMYRIPITKFAARNKEEGTQPIELIYISEHHPLNAEILNPLEYLEKQKLSKLN